MLSEEYGIKRQTINTMVSRYLRKDNATFGESISRPVMARKKIPPTELSSLQAENEALRRQLKMARLKIEGYQIMGEILSEEYGVDLLKKAEAGQCHVSKKDTQK